MATKTRSEEAVETTEAVQETIALDIDDIRTGMQFEQEEARAQARLQAATDAKHLFLDRMRAKYQTNDAQFIDWITGFQVKKE